MPSTFEHELERHKSEQNFDRAVAEHLAKRLGKTSPTGVPNPEEVKRLTDIVKKRVDEKMQKEADSWT
jgi:hypothetical protein